MASNTTEKIIQWNVQGISTSKEDLIKLIDENKPLLISVQETFLANNYIVNLRNYNCICKQGHYNHRFHGGVAMYIHESCPFSEIKIDTPLQMVAARINVAPSKLITVVSAYFPGRIALDVAEMMDIINSLPKPVIVMGDFNAHHSVWGNSTIDRRGRLLEEALRNSQLNVINENTATHSSGTAIDLTIVSPELTDDTSWRTLPSLLSSDHFPILISISKPEPAIASSDHYNYKRGNWMEYTSDPIWESLPDVSDDPKTAIDDMYSLFEELRGKWIPKYKSGRFYPKPWWSEECSRVWRIRESMYRQYKRTSNVEDKVNWKRARAVATRTFREEKKREWQEYVSKLNINSTASSVWDKVRKIRGREPRKIHVIKEGDSVFSSTHEIANIIGRTLSEITSDNNYAGEFAQYKTDQEIHPLVFDSSNQERYNTPITLDELHLAIDNSKDNSPGPDDVHNKMMRAMPIKGRKYLLKVVNVVWNASYFDDRWRNATVIPIPKPNKNHADPRNYRPISLTSCVCKIIEKVINCRLVEFLEINKFFAHNQCGFRKHRSTVDHLVRFETYVRSAIAESKFITSIFFDMEKAYDKTWRYGIMRDMHRLGLRGRLPQFIAEFLKQRRFSVRINDVISESRIQETGVPQGSTLSVTLFAIKINSLHRTIPSDVFSSMYVDDIQIAYSHYSQIEVQRKLQTTIDKISRWAKYNGFSFSPTKTVGMQFYKRKPMTDIRLQLENSRIPIADTAKFLGLTWDSKLSWIPHISQLRDRCAKSLNLLRTVSSSSWGADSTTTMNLYRALVRSKMDYGAIVYGSASAAALAPLNTVANDAMRIATGAFRTTPISSLQILTNEPSLELRRQELTVKYYVKLKAHIQNPAFNSVFNSNLRLFFNSRPTTKPPFIIRAEETIRSMALNIQPILPHKTPTFMSHELKPPEVNFDLCCFKKDEVPPEVMRGMHQELISMLYPHHNAIYTDGSKTNDGVGSAAVFREGATHSSLCKVASIFTAELKAIQMALEYIGQRPQGNFLICSDSKSVLQAISSYAIANGMVYRTRVRIRELEETGRNVVLCWTPSHVGIIGNERADREAGIAASRAEEFVPIPYRDWYPKIEGAAREIWKRKWNAERRYTYEVKDAPGKWKKIKNISRRKEVVISRLRLGHCKLTHEYLVKEFPCPPPICRWCDSAVMTVKHILVDCDDLKPTRQRFLSRKRLNISNLLGDEGIVREVIAFLDNLNVMDLI